MQATNNNSSKKVFVSYAHIDKEYEQKVLEFTNYLRTKGIDANVDLYEEAPSEGWPRWMENQIGESDYVLVICSKVYCEKLSSKNATGKGVKWEGAILYNELYSMGATNKKYIPVYFDKTDSEYIPTPLQQFSHYCLDDDSAADDDSDKERLIKRILGLSIIERPPIGKEPSPLESKAKKPQLINDEEEDDLITPVRRSLMVFLDEETNQEQIKRAYDSVTTSIRHYFCKRLYQYNKTINYSDSLNREKKDILCNIEVDALRRVFNEIADCTRKLKSVGQDPELLEGKERLLDTLAQWRVYVEFLRAMQILDNMSFEMSRNMLDRRTRPDHINSLEYQNYQLEKDSAERKENAVFESIGGCFRSQSIDGRSI